MGLIIESALALDRLLGQCYPLVAPRRENDMLAAGIGPIGPFEALIILLVVVLIFGVNKVGDLGGALGKSVREFRKAARDPNDHGDDSTVLQSPVDSTTPASSQTAERFCSNCGAQLAGQAKFCAQCGASTQATVS